MMRRALLALVALAGLGGAAAAQNGANRDFTVHNQLAQAINSMWISSEGDPSWHAVSGSYVAPGGQTKVQFFNIGPCKVQVRLKLANGDVPEWDDPFDVCTLNDMTVFRAGDGQYHMRYN